MPAGRAPLAGRAVQVGGRVGPACETGALPVRGAVGEDRFPDRIRYAARISVALPSTPNRMRIRICCGVKAARLALLGWFALRLVSPRRLSLVLRWRFMLASL